MAKPNSYPDSIRDLQPPFHLHHALEVIGETYGAKTYYKNKTLIKFGRYESLGTSYETVQGIGGNETYLTDNLILYVSSSNTGDTQSISIEGHTIDASGNLTFVVQYITLQGQTSVALTTPLARMTRIRNAGATNFAGTIYGYENDTVSSGVPQTSTKIHIIAGAGNTSEKCSTSVSSDDYWAITALTSGVLKKTSASVDFKLQIREKGGVFIDRFYIPSSQTNNLSRIELNPPMPAPANSDVRMVARASTTAVEVVAQISGYLAKKYEDI